MINLKNIQITNLTHIELLSIKDHLLTEFDDFWNYEVFNSELNNPHSHYLVAKYNDEIIGFAGILVVLDEADITNIVIKKSYRGFGISKLLLKSLLNLAFSLECKKINLEVSSSNLIAISLYEKHEFKSVGRRKNYYKTSDAILMSLIKST